MPNRITSPITLVSGASKRPNTKSIPRYDLPIVDPPEYLKGDARLKWCELIPQMVESGAFHQTDTDILAGYCVNHALIVACVQELQIQDGGLPYEKADGSKGINPTANLLQKAMLQQRQYSQVLGLDPCSRTRIVVPKTHKKGAISGL